MKKLILVFCAAVALVGCNSRNEGGTGSTSDQTGTSSGTSVGTNTSSSSRSTITNSSVTDTNK